MNKGYVLRRRFFLIGTFLILSSCALLAYNLNENYQADKYAEAVMMQFHERLPEQG